MLAYLIILLDETSTSYCVCENPHRERKLIRPETLRAGIVFAMKENLRVQFVYPDYELPQEYQTIIEIVDHSRIQPSTCADAGAEVVVFNGWDEFSTYRFNLETVYILRTDKDDFFNQYNLIASVLDKVKRLNVVITDVETFDEEDLSDYPLVLKALSDKVKELYLQGKNPQINLLTDRMMLKEINHCNAGWQNITLAPNGKFYICPAFYYQDEADHVGDLSSGLQLRNAQLYQLDHAPICRKCDAYQCKRCIWLNRKTTLEVNTPSYEQCVAAHLERNASRQLLADIRREAPSFLKGQEIIELSYLDPFEISKRF